MKKNPGTPVIFVVLEDVHKNKMIEGMQKLTEKVKLLPIVITDVKDKHTRDYL